MGNSRQLRAGRTQKTQTLRQQIREVLRENAYLKGLVMSLEAQLAATKMERPPDLDSWIESVIPDMSDEERAEWEAMDPDQRERFLDDLGLQINTTMKLGSIGLTADDAGESPSPAASGQGS